MKKIKQARKKETTEEGIHPLAFLSRDDYLASLILTTLTLAVYAFTAAPGVTLADSGDFLNGVLTLGVVHPPGYPLYTVLGHLFTYLPLGDPAFRVNLFSAFWGSLCLAILFLILRLFSIQRIHAVFATLFLGFTTIFWSKTGIAEVYSFNAFLLSSLFFCILCYNRDKKKTQLYLVFLITGLALSNHYPLVLLTGLGLVFLLDRRDLDPRDLVKAFMFLGLGLIPYLYLFIRASNPQLEYNFGKTSDLASVLDHILRRYYIDQYGGTVSDKLRLALTFLHAIITNFLFSSLFLFAGITFSFQHKFQYRYPALLAALSPSLGLILILTLPADERYRSQFLDFLIPTFLFLSIFLAIGLKHVMNRYVKNKVFEACLLVMLLVSQFGFNFPSASHHNDKLAEVWASDLLSSLKPSSILILCGPGQFQFPPYYLQVIKGLRQDVTLYDRFSGFTTNNLYGPELLFKRKDASEYRKRREEQLINNSPRPIYYTCKDVLQEQDTDFSVTPFVFRADKRHLEVSDPSASTVSDNLLDSLVNGYPKSEHWLDRIRKMIFSRLITYYGAHNQAEVKRILNYFMKTKYYSDPQSVVALANNLYYVGNFRLARSFYERAEELSPQALSATDLAVFCDILVRARNYRKALRICVSQEQSSRPCDVNTLESRARIAAIYKERQNWPKVAEYSRKILRCQPNHKGAETYLKLARQRMISKEAGSERSSSAAPAPATSVRAKKPVPDNPLRLLSFDCYAGQQRYFIEGEVENISSRPLRNVVAVGRWRTEEGTLVRSTDALVEYDPLLPGQASPFKVATRKDPGIEKCGVLFKHLSGGAIGFER